MCAGERDQLPGIDLAGTEIASLSETLRKIVSTEDCAR